MADNRPTKPYTAPARISSNYRTSGSPASTADLRAALLRIRAGIAADRCDGESEWARGVNAACKNHLEFVDTVLAEAGVNTADGGQR